MTKTQRLEGENKKMKETLERVHCLCEMAGEERRQYMREKGFEERYFSAAAMGEIQAISEMVLREIKEAGK